MSTDASNTPDGRVVDKSRYLPNESEDWSEWTKYQCGFCGENCINPEVSVYTEANRCVRCFLETEDERVERLEQRKTRQWMPDEIPPRAGSWSEVKK